MVGIPTPGTWSVHEYVVPEKHYYIRTSTGYAVVSGLSLKNKADADLMAEAGTVYNEIKQSPQQLRVSLDNALTLVKQLREALVAAEFTLVHTTQDSKYDRVKQIIHDAIDSAENCK